MAVKSPSNRWAASGCPTVPVLHAGERFFQEYGSQIPVQVSAASVWEPFGFQDRSHIVAMDFGDVAPEMIVARSPGTASPELAFSATTTLAPSSAAEMAAIYPAIPPPATRTSQEIGVLSMAIMVCPLIIACCYRHDRIKYVFTENSTAPNVVFAPYRDSGGTSSRAVVVEGSRGHWSASGGGHPNPAWAARLPNTRSRQLKHSL